jgi:hypothetical protein
MTDSGLKEKLITKIKKTDDLAILEEVSRLFVLNNLLIHGPNSIHSNIY